MTLTSYLRIDYPVSVRDLFTYGQSLLGDPEKQEWSHVHAGDLYPWSDTLAHDNHAFRNDLGQGLAGIWEVEYGEPYHDDPCECDPEDDYDCGCTTRPKCLVQCSIDTSYSYNQGGATCTDLHAWFFTELYVYLLERGVPWDRIWWRADIQEGWHQQGLHKLGDACKLTSEMVAKR